MSSDDDTVCLLGYVGTGDSVWRLAVCVTHLDDGGDMRGECVFTASKSTPTADGAADGLFKRVSKSEFEAARASSDMGIVRGPWNALRSGCVFLCA